jgi:hypothetical protein
VKTASGSWQPSPVDSGKTITERIYGIALCSIETSGFGQLIPVTFMQFADFVKSDSAVATFNIGGVSTQVSGADIFQAVGLGAALPAFNSGFVRQGLDAAILPMGSKITDVHGV